MVDILYPPGIREVASRFGCDLPESTNLARFGFASTRGAPPPTTAAAVKRKMPTTKNEESFFSDPTRIKKLEQKARTTASQPAVALGFSNTDPKVALAIADRLLASPNIPNAQEVVRNTMAVAARPSRTEASVAVQQGAAVIDAAAQIREQTGAKPGEPAIPVTNPAMQAAVDHGMVTSAVPLSGPEAAALDSFFTESESEPAEKPISPGWLVAGAVGAVAGIMVLGKALFGGR